MSVRQGKETRHDSASGVLKGIAGAGAALATEDGALDPVFRLIFDHIGIGLWQSTPEGRYLRVNQSCADLMGYESPEAAVDAIGDIAREIYVEPSERDAFKSLLTRDGAVTGFVARHRRRDGSEWWARLSAVAVRGADGQPKFYVGSAEDVTALIETQEQLRAAERDMREVWENAAEGMYRSSPDGKQLRANPALVRLNGYATEADMLSGVNDIASEWYVDPTRRDEFKRILREHGRVTDFQSEVYRHKTRERIWVSENAWEVRDEGGRLQYYEGSVRDITAEKRAAQRLGESEQRFRDYADTASDWFWESDREHRFTYLSSSERRPNLRDSAVIGKKRWDQADDVAEEPAKWAAHMASLERHEPFRNFVFRMRNVRGEAEYVSASGKPTFDASGEFQGYRGSARRITEQMRHQELLRESEERFRDFADTASDWFWETGPDHRLSFVSETASMLSGGVRSKAIGKERRELAADVEAEPEKWANFDAILARRDPFRDFRYRVRVSSGEIHHVAVSGKPFFASSGAFLGYRGSSRVITEQVRQQEALLQSEARFRDFAATASDWFWESDEEHRFTYFSPSPRFGPGAPFDGIGKCRWELGLDVESEPEKWQEHRATIDRREPFRDFVHVVRMANGEIHHKATSGTPIFGPDGTFRGYRGSSRIVSDAFRQAEALREAKAVAEAASASKSAFLANMSHELRTPLNAIIGFSEIMDRQMFGKIGVPRYIDYVKDIRDSAQHLLRLIEDILDLSKAEAGKMELEESEVDLGASIRSACLMLRERAKQGGVALSEDVVADLPPLWGDRRRIRQILLNLVSNAVKFTPRNGSVKVGAFGDAEGALHLTVVDTGIGIEPRDIERVFEPFVQLGRDKALSSGEGTGLGLPLCKELVEMHGGTIGLTSEVGVGTTVTVNFPPSRSLAKRAAA